MSLDLRRVIVEAVERICVFNLKVTHGRLGPEAHKQCSTEQDIGNQAKLVLEESNEYKDSRDLVNLTKEAVDLLVTEAWMLVLEEAYHINGTPMLAAIAKVRERLATGPITLKCLEPMIFLSRIGVDIEYAIDLVLKDNDSKFIHEVHEASRTVDRYRHLNIDCEARPVDAFQKEWGVFRLPDLKMLKPYSYMARAAHGAGLDIEKAVPPHMRSMVLFPESAIMGDTDIRKHPARRDTNDYAK